jgi:hypothetical protein
MVLRHTPHQRTGQPETLSTNTPKFHPPTPGPFTRLGGLKRARVRTSADEDFPFERESQAQTTLRVWVRGVLDLGYPHDSARLGFVQLGRWLAHKRPTRLPPRGGVRVSGRANTPSWVYRKAHGPTLEYRQLPHGSSTLTHSRTRSSAAARASRPCRARPPGGPSACAARTARAAPRHPTLPPWGPAPAGPG